MAELVLPGQLRGEIHEGVAWWLGACLVVITEARHIAVGYDGTGTAAVFLRRLCRGAVNAGHYACRVIDLRSTDENELRAAMKELGDVPGAFVTTTSAADGETVRIVLYDAEGQPLTEESGLAEIRTMIAEDRVPIPVNEAARGSIQRYSRAEGDQR